jgi:O-antigen ligase
LVAVIALISIYLLREQFFGAIELVINKTETVGLNKKDLEVRTVLYHIGQSPSLVLLGTGWGGVFDNPAIYANVKISFTHSLISYALLKTGLIGFVLVCMYLLFIINRIVVNYDRKRLPVLLAGLPPLLIGLFFQPSYKTLMYGFVLLALILTDKDTSRKNKGLLRNSLWTG